MPTQQELEWLQTAARDRAMNEWVTTAHPELLALPEAQQIAIKEGIVREMAAHEWDWNHNNIEASYCVDVQNRTPAEATGSDTDLQAMPLDKLREHFERMDEGRSKSSYVQRYHR